VSAGRWLVKSEPGAYSWDRLVLERRARWDGVRNALARNHLAAMSRGDLVLFYHSGEGKQIVGVARVARTAYPDPTADDAKWLAVDLVPVKPLARAVTLAEIKADPALRAMPLVRQTRLSVMPVDAKAFARVLEASGTRLPSRSR
jgi:predicted RNA-binding protein with PUA-like domain